MRRTFRWVLAPNRRSLTLVIAILLGSSFIAFGTGFWLLFRLSYVVALGLPLSYFIAWYNVRGLEVTVDRRTDRAQVGQEAQGVIEVRNRGLLPRFWVEAEDPSEMPRHRSKRVILLAPRRSRNWIVDTRLVRRFGSVDHDKLLKLIAQRVADGRVLRLIEGMLKVNSFGQGELQCNRA